LTVAGSATLLVFEARIVMFLNPKAALLPMWVIAGLHLGLAPAQAQTQSAAPAAATVKVNRPDPADPKAQVPPTLYVSPLRAYQAFTEPQVAPWRETNDLVRQRGGWRSYAREAREPDAARPAAPAASQPVPAATPASGGHASHGMK
jgi:hypothetical protein